MYGNMKFILSVDQDISRMRSRSVILLKKSPPPSQHFRSESFQFFNTCKIGLFNVMNIFTKVQSIIYVIIYLINFSW